MLTRISLVMQVTTTPTDPSSAIAHTGGWTEQFWAGDQIASGNPTLPTFARARASLLPRQASVVGVRLAYYDISGNKLIPKGTQTLKISAPGNPTFETDLPQVSLEMNGTTITGPNTSRFRLRCIPDYVMVGGEYQPDATFKRLVTNYGNGLAAAAAVGFIGRNLSLPTARVLSIAGNTVTLDGNIGAVLGSSYIRFNRTTDSQGKPVQGTYRVVDFAAPGTYTVAGLELVTAGNSGTARVDGLSFFDYATINPVRAVIKKIGRPFESYRGRQSKRRPR